MKKREVFLIQFSDFSLGSGLYIAKALSLLGLNVSIVTNRPIYSTASQASEFTKFDFNAKVIEIPIPFTKVLYNSIIGRLIFYSWFMSISLLKILIEKPRPNIIYSRGPQPFTEIVCVLYKLFNNDVKIISDTTDLWPDALEYLNFNRLFKRLLIAIGHAINYLVYKKVDAIVTLNEIMAQVLRTRIKRDVHVIYRCIDLDVFRPMNKNDALKHLPREISKFVEGKFVVLYAGVMGAFQNVLVMADIAEEMKNKCSDVVFLVIGSGPLKPELQEITGKKSLSNTLVFDAVPHGLTPFVYNIADLTLLPPPIFSVPGMYEYFVITLPRKFIEYAACGKPILCLTPPCVASELCLKWKAGYHVLPNDTAKIREIITSLKESEELRKLLGRNAREMAEKLFSLENTAVILKKIIESENF